MLHATNKKVTSKYKMWSNLNTHQLFHITTIESMVGPIHTNLVKFENAPNLFIQFGLPDTSKQCFQTLKMDANTKNMQVPEDEIIDKRSLLYRIQTHLTERPCRKIMSPRFPFELNVLSIQTDLHSICL